MVKGHLFELFFHETAIYINFYVKIEILILDYTTSDIANKNAQIKCIKTQSLRSKILSFQRVSKLYRYYQSYILNS